MGFNFFCLDDGNRPGRDPPPGLFLALPMDSRFENMDGVGQRKNGYKTFSQIHNMEKRDMGKMQWVITFGHFCSSPPPITTKDTKFRIWEFLRVTDCYMCISNISYQLLQKHYNSIARVFRYLNSNFPFYYNIAILLEKGRNKWFKMTHFSKFMTDRPLLFCQSGSAPNRGNFVKLSYCHNKKYKSIFEMSWSKTASCFRIIERKTVNPRNILIMHDACMAIYFKLHITS